MGFLDSSSADDGGAILDGAGSKKNNCPIVNTCVDAHCPYGHEAMLTLFYRF